VVRVLLTLHDVVVIALVLAAATCVIGTCSQGRLEHALLWILGAVPRERPSFSSRIPRREHYWSVIGRLSDDAPEESSERVA
jgi:hypothetical protein